MQVLDLCLLGRHKQADELLRQLGITLRLGPAMFEESQVCCAAT